MASADGCVLPVPRGKGQAVVLPQWDRSTPTCVGWDINYRDDRLVEDREKPVLDILSTPPPMQATQVIRGARAQAITAAHRVCLGEEVDQLLQGGHGVLRIFIRQWRREVVEGGL